MLANSGEPEQTPQSAASGLVLHCLPMTHKKDTRQIWVKSRYGLVTDMSDFNVKTSLED